MSEREGAEARGGPLLSRRRELSCTLSYGNHPQCGHMQGSSMASHPAIEVP